ncbi:DNA recombination protein RmuC [Ruminococcus bromii]|uniref:RmuC family protein n=2 Tax=Ruminococcus bromii TaxID=40518 RepID=A0A2N0UQV1_9FIRM|nr:DNA recombination protein RmuC [Ruminococcus bromii]PKD29345.1 RmuC family protein [Ruminococcus bromii]
MQFTTAEIILLLLCLITLTVSIITLITVFKKNSNNKAEDELQKILLNQQSFAQSQNDRAVQLEQRLHSFSSGNTQSLENIRRSVDEKLESIRRENLRQLDEMRQTVDEKLQKTLEEKMNKSFSLVNERLEQVYKGLGEMQTLAVGVGDLKKVLSNVKTRGILGEIQLGAILSEILSKEQYEENIATKKGSKNVVEFAVKLPSDGAGTVYLPIDSKFPGDTYSALREAVESGDRQSIESAKKALVQRIKGEAKDIHDKYIDPPNTTEFAIMFLPFEGLYSEVVNMGLVEVLQREYKVNIAGPSTMAALLNSLQMGFKTLAVQKRSAEVWKILGGVKTEFDKFNDVLVMTQQRLDQANKELDKLVGVRTRQIQRQLKDVESVSLSEQNLFE